MIGAIQSLLLISLLAAAAAWPAPAQHAAKPTPLDEYVAKPDPAYSWKPVHEVPGQGFRLHVIEMQSQSWLTEEQVDRTVWTHWLNVYEPDEIRHGVGLLFISGGSNGGDPPSKPEQHLARMAVDTSSVVAELKMVPNQPLNFSGDPRGPVYEDALIAYNWKEFLDTSDPIWLTRLPMTKSAVRAMDTVTAFMEPRGRKVEKFFVTGASKRGWTAWTTAAVDQRVIGVAPIVIDLLNIVPSFIHHYRAYGFWAPAVKDYYEAGIMDRFRSPEYSRLLEIVEPYSYRDRLTMPKYIVNSAGDQFFLPDSSQFYFDDLTGEKYLRYVPNSDHSLRDTDAVESLAAFYHAVLGGRPRPRFSWSFEADGSIRVNPQDKPAEVKLWSAHNPEARDFRLGTLGPAYESVNLEPGPGGVYAGRVPKPSQGWTAFFVELTYPGGIAKPMKFTTGVRVLPDAYPYPEPEAGKTHVGSREP